MLQWVCIVCISFTLTITVTGKPAVIHGGLYVEANELQFVVAVVSKETATSQLKLCTGSVFHEKYVLTAGHCLGDASSHTVNVYFRTETGMITAKTWKLHEEFSVDEAGGKFNNDIAVIELAESATTLTGGKLMELPKTSEIPPTGTNVVIAGFGLDSKEISEPISSKDLRLKRATVNVTGVECKMVFPHCLNGLEVTGLNCKGDDGGPMLFNDILIGISSAVSEKCLHGESAEFTLVYPYLDWIKKNVLVN